MSGMIALVPEDRELDRLVIEGGEAREELHLTLMFLGEDEDWSEEARESVRQRMRAEADELTLLHGNAFGAAVWNPDGQDPCVVLNVGGDWLQDVHAGARQAVYDVSNGPSPLVENVPEQHKPWSPHITLAYDTSRIDDAVARIGPVMFDRIRVVWGDEPVDFNLGSGSTIPLEDVQEAVIMPWHKSHNHSGCPSSKPWAVVKDSDGSVAGCHATESDADAQLAALYGSEGDNTVDTHEGEDTFAVDNTPWDGGAAMKRCNDAACYRSISAGRRAGPPDERGSYALPHHKTPGGPPNAGGVRNALARLDQTEGLTNKAEARAHLERHMASIRAQSNETDDNEELTLTVTETFQPEDQDAAPPSDVGDCPPGHHKMPNGDCMPDVGMAEEVQPEVAGETLVEDDRWHGVLAVEGIPTGDGREFAPGSLEWRNLPLSLYWQRKTADGHDASVIVGSIESIWRDGGAIRATGRFNLDAPKGGESFRDAWDAYQLVRDGFMRGVSVTLDDVNDNDVEMVWPEPEEGEEEEEPMGGLAALFMQPEKIIFHHGRIIDSTLTGQPALQEAFVACGPYEESAQETAMSVVVPAHSSGTTDGAWDGALNLRSLGPLSADLVAHSFAWVRGTAGERPTRSDCMFLHHEISDDGKPGLANLTACAAAIGMLNGARGGANIPVSDRQGVYDHLAQHLRDAGREPQPLVSPEEAEHLALVAAAVMAPVAPPKAWFENPNFNEITPLMVGDDGWIRGHLARWGVCHTSFPGTCVTPPHEDDYSFFTTGEMITREGVRVPVGQLTLGTGHAPAGLGARPASVHYDHTGYAAADVAAGADEHGIWIAGALCPDVDEITIRRLRASALSGDWRRIGGQLRLVAALVVNVPGFPIPRTKTRTQDGAQTALVASGIVTSIEPPARHTSELSPRVAKLVAEALEARVRGPIAARLAERVHAS